jgi:hypothetical protein
MENGLDSSLDNLSFLRESPETHKIKLTGGDYMLE